MMLPVLDIKKYKEMERKMMQRVAVSVSAVERRKLRVLQQCGWSCVKCGRRGGLTIDHRKQYGNREHKNKYMIEECAVLCRECHEKKNGWRKEDE